MAFDVRKVELKQLNSLTKYPSIATFHQLDPSNGNLLEQPMLFADSALATEKVDGTNARIIVLPDHTFILGSREELLYARGDLIGNPALGIVDALKAKAESFVDAATMADEIIVLYGELFGGKISKASKQYTSTQQVGFRLFDIARIKQPLEVLNLPLREISEWREQGMQGFVAEAELQEFATTFEFALTPRLFTLEHAAIPSTIDEAYTLLSKHSTTTHCLLDQAAGGEPEGIVLRSLDRTHIAKLRLEDYRRTLRRRKT